MLSREKNELLTRTGPGTPMGTLLRRYWLPAALSLELPEPDGAPVRVRLLGEQLVAFRDSSGRIGLLREFCAHRGASLFFGRNEECGLRCIYHGWKYDASGNCVDMMNEPADLDFQSKIRLSAYPTMELGGLVWTYLGPPEQQPPLPRFAWALVPESHRHVYKTWQECNWLQALEGGIDTSHANILHRRLHPTDARHGIVPSATFVRAGAPRLEVYPHEYGYLYAGVRSLDDEQVYVRTYHYVMPFTQIRPGPLDMVKPHNAGHIWIPMDDENCMVYHWTYSMGAEPLSEEDRLEPGSGREPSEHLPDFRKVRNKDNNYLIDRQAQKTELFSGIVGINNQDNAVQESMGPIVDRTQEHLGPADKAIIIARQMLLDAVDTARAGGDPPGVHGDYEQLHAIVGAYPRDGSWQAAAGGTHQPLAAQV
jgi:phthalate 4,5-dioxygenase